MDINSSAHSFQAAETHQESGGTANQAPSHSWISLKMVKSAQILHLADRTEFTLGRSAESQPIVPDVDLTPYDAYTHGVSRLHAVLKRLKDKVVIMDLGSSNGTYLNGNRLQPYVETRVVDQDIIHLGKLKVQLLIR
jgi:pSer/pThr/pTyr-binding forkhead associated (FHA) protein